MRTTAMAALVLYVGISSAAPAGQQASLPTGAAPEVELKIAMNRELLDGDFAAAVERYRAMAVRFRTTAPDVANRAEALAEASAARLGATAQHRAALTIQRVTDGGADHVSPDGRYLLRAETDVELFDIASGQVRVVTSDGNDNESDHRYPIGGVFSRDGRRIAYHLYIENEDRSILRTVAIPAEGAGTSMTLYDNREIDTIAPMDWSPDGRWIAVSIGRRDLTAQIGLVSATDGSLRVIRSTDWRGVTNLVFSPDGRFLAYDLREGDDEIDRDVFVMQLEGLRETSVVAHPGDDRLVGWSPDGGRLLFSSDRGGTIGLWAVTVANGRASGGAAFLSEFGIARPVGLTNDGVLFTQVLQSGADIWVSAFDRSSGQLTAEPVKLIRRFQGLNLMPFWSPDGQHLAYVSRRDPQGPSPVFIVISSAETGDVLREFRPKLSYLSFPSWSPDGRTMIARGADLKGRSGIVKIDVATGAAALVVPNETCSGVPYWAASGRTFFCYRFTEGEVAEVDVDTGDVRRTFPGGQGKGAPDGRSIAYSDRAGLKLHPLGGGEPRLLLAGGPDTDLGNLQTVAFTPDGRHLVFGGRLRGAQSMWMLDVDGGEPRRIDVSIEPVSTWRFNPVTWQVAITSTNMPRFEIRRIENFLPGPR